MEFDLETLENIIKVTPELLKTSKTYLKFIINPKLGRKKEI